MHSLQLPIIYNTTNFLLRQVFKRKKLVLVKHQALTILGPSHQTIGTQIQFGLTQF